MSKLQELINEICPYGVEYKALKDISDMKRGNSLTKAKSASGEYPVISGGKEPAFFCDQYNRDGETITVAGSGAGAGYVQYFNKPIFANDCFTVKGNKTTSTKYLYYCLTNKQEYIQSTKKGGGVPHVHISDIENMKLPVPPLPVQEEIVRILDKMTGYVTELKSELKARKMQYEHYKNTLLSRDKSISMRTIESLCKVSAGGDVPKNAMAKEKTDEYTFPIISNGVGKNALYGYTNQAKITEPAVTVAARGTIGYAEYREYPYVPIVRLLSLIPKNTEELDAKFLYYCLQGKKYSIPTTGIPQLTAPMVKQVEIPLPTIEQQKHIVSILNRFDSLCNDISSGLPAEIETRQKQYEYYRDKLLSFKEINHDTI